MIPQSDGARAPSWATPSAPSRNINEFIRPYRQHIASLICCSDQLSDLVTSFPAMLFALTTDFSTAEKRAACVQLINESAPLRAAANALGLPWWMKNIPASALRQPFGALPSGKEFSHQIVNLMPKTEPEMRYWLRRVLFAYQACDADYALWMARHKRFPFRDRADEPHILLGAWAWYSKQSGMRGSDLVRTGWSPRISLRKAHIEARAWAHRLRLWERLGNGLRDTWLKGGKVGIYEIVPLVTANDFINEAKIMNNCLDQYGDQVTRENARVFSMRTSGKHVANLEIGFHDDDPTIPMFEQIKGPKNKRAAGEVWQAAYTWLGSQQYRPFKEGVRGGKKICKMIKAEIWAPYLNHLGDGPHRTLVEDFARYNTEHRRAALHDLLAQISID